VKPTLLLPGVLAALLIVPACAVADATTQDPTVKIILQAAQTTPDGDVFVGSLSPSFLVETLYAGPTVQCHVDGASDGPCGTQITTGCPAVTCWRYVPALPKGGFHIMTVDYDVPDGIPGSLDFQFNADATAPDTVLHGPPAPEESLLPSVSANQHPTFDVSARDDFLTSNDHFECTVARLGAGPGSFRTCDTSKPLPRLRLTATYVYRVRTVDFLGRPDPTPSQYEFSPTPCRPRLLGHVHSLARIVAHGLRVRIVCVQPGRFQVLLELPLRETELLHLPSRALAELVGRMRRQGESRAMTVHALRGIPTFLFQIARLRVDLTADETLYGAPGVLTDILHR
jgi:hypothetical protein